MSLKWYSNAVVDETQVAYGKTWKVDRIEADGAIVFRCGKETALAPRTDTAESLDIKAIDKRVLDALERKAEQVILNRFNAAAPRLKELAAKIMANSKAVQDAMSVKSLLDGLPSSAIFIHDEIIWDRALTDQEARSAYSWIMQNWSKHFTLDCNLPDRRTGQEGRTVAKKMKCDV